MSLNSVWLNNNTGIPKPPIVPNLNHGIYKKSKLIIEKDWLKFIQNDDWSLEKTENWKFLKETWVRTRLLTEEILAYNENLQMKEKIIKEIDKNFPLLRLLKEFQNWWEYNAMIFTWIKKLNDTKGQSFTDKILSEFKRLIQQKESWLWIKIVFDDYKNFIVAKSDWTNLSAWDRVSLQKILDWIFVKYSQEANPIKVFSETWKIEKNLSQVEIVTKFAKTRSNLEKQATENESINIATNFEWVIDLENNIKGKYINFKESVKTPKNVIYEVWNAILTKKFKVNWKEVTEKIRIFERKNWKPDWEIILTLNIINMVRKWEIPKNLELYKDIVSFIKSCIVYWEFILPWDKKSELLANWEIVDKKTFDNYIDIISKIENWNIPDTSNNFRAKTYKDALNKEVFYESIKEKWNLFYIDIKWMWWENIRDFFGIIKKTVENKSLSTEEERLEYSLFHSWDIMTNKIKKFKEFIEEKFWESIKIYIWWDEIIFFTSKTVKNYNNIFQKAEKLWLNIRLTTKKIAKKSLNKTWEENVSELDKLTKISKILEKRIDLLKETMELNKLKWKNYEKNFNLVKDFVLFIKNWKQNISFINAPFEWKNTFEASEIIDLKKEELISNSIFIKFLEEKFDISK